MWRAFSCWCCCCCPIYVCIELVLLPYLWGEGGEMWFNLLTHWSHNKFEAFVFASVLFYHVFVYISCRVQVWKCEQVGCLFVFFLFIPFKGMGQRYRKTVVVFDTWQRDSEWASEMRQLERIEKWGENKKGSRFLIACKIQNTKRFHESMMWSTVLRSTFQIQIRSKERIREWGEARKKHITLKNWTQKYKNYNSRLF